MVSGYLDRILKHAEDLDTGEAQSKCTERLMTNCTFEAVPMETTGNSHIKVAIEKQLEQDRLTEGQSALICCPQNEVNHTELPNMLEGHRDTAIIMRHETGDHKGKLRMLIDGVWADYDKGSSKLAAKKVICLYTKDSVGGDFDKWSNENVVSQALVYTKEVVKINDLYQNFRRYRGEEPIHTTVYTHTKVDPDIDGGVSAFIANAVTEEVKADERDYQLSTQSKIQRQCEKALRQDHKEKSLSITLKCKIKEKEKVDMTRIWPLNTAVNKKQEILNRLLTDSGLPEGLIRISGSFFKIDPLRATGSPTEINQIIDGLERFIETYTTEATPSEFVSSIQKMRDEVTELKGTLETEFEDNLSAQKGEINAYFKDPVQSRKNTFIEKLPETSKHREMADYFTTKYEISLARAS